MSHQHGAPRRLPLSLPADAQWFVHYLASHRLDSGGSPVGGATPGGTATPGEAATPGVARQVRERMEAGDHAFTPTELRFLRAELVCYLRTVEPADRTGSIARLTVDRVDRALERVDRGFVPSA